MAQHDSNPTNNTSDETLVDGYSMVEELANAKKEIQDLKMKLMWMERNYE